MTSVMLKSLLAAFPKADRAAADPRLQVSGRVSGVAELLTFVLHPKADAANNEARRSLRLI